MINTKVSHKKLYIDPYMALYHSPNYQINCAWTFNSGEEVQNRFPRQQLSWILALFLSTSHPAASYQDWSQLAFRVRSRGEK